MWFVAFFLIVIGFIIHYILTTQSVFYYEKRNNQMVTNLNKIRRLAHDFPEDNIDESRFKQDITKICNYVCQTIIGINDQVKNCREYCVVVFFVSGANQRDEDSYNLVPIAHDNSVMGNYYYKLLEKNILSGYKHRIALKDNSSFYTVYKAYIKEKTHQAEIVTKENVKKKAKRGEYQSTFVNLPDFGYSRIPYNSSCVLPILPFHNTNKIGNEMQGYLAIMSNKKKAFRDNVIEDTDFASFLESVSGLLYKVCTKDKSKDKKDEE